MRKSTRRLPVAVALWTLACASPASAQKVTTIPDLTARQVLAELSNATIAAPAGEAIALTTALEISTEPFGTSSGGFVFKLDPSTGLLARTTTTFGPSFTERALTSGEGQVNVGVTFSSMSYDELSGFSLSALPLATVTGTTSITSGDTTANLAIRNSTVAISGSVGVTENLDVGVVVPLVSLKISGRSSFVNNDRVVGRLAETNNVFSGIGDIAALVKYRVLKFKGPDLPDPGGVALLVNMRLPTGDRDNLRGLGVTRTLVSGVVSGGRGRLGLHGSGGFDFWSKAVEIASTPGETVSVRHQVQYAAGIEVEAAPKVTLLVDFVGQHIMDGGQVGVGPVTPVTNVPGVTSVQSLIGLPESIRKALLVPGLKVNLKGKLLLSLSAIITLKNDGLRAKITPVAGLNLTM